MGCCQSSTTREEEIAPKRIVAGERSTQALRSREDLDVCDIQGEPGAPHTEDIGEVTGEEGEEKRVVLEDVLERISTEGWKYFIVDTAAMHNNIVDEGDDEEGDWSTNFDSRALPADGLPPRDPALFGDKLNSQSPSAALSMLTACRPAPSKFLKMVELSHQLHGSLSSFVLLPVRSVEGSEISIYSEVNLDLSDDHSHASPTDRTYQ
eukprot:TRINITY_DN3345_c0_g1_i1.p1 TRINITY_DN3345_c0_g1~~TRINITY_DN3345_c0_g1_i1.p1  ORF type:complete len:208 (+),score=45.02 TRINITY_DN3345_c0_g1_i1:125-748(+)